MGSTAHDAHQVPHRIPQNGPLAALDLLAPVKPAFAANRRRFYALTVDRSGTWLCFPSGCHAHAFAQFGIDPFPDPRSAPTPKMMIHTVVIGVLIWQHFP